MNNVVTLIYSNNITNVSSLFFLLFIKNFINKITYPITSEEAPILNRLNMNKLMRCIRCILTMKLVSPWTMYRKMKSFSFKCAWQIIWLAAGCLPINLIALINDKC